MRSLDSTSDFKATWNKLAALQVIYRPNIPRS